MKKESKTYGLFKILLICILFVAILTWIVPSGSYDSGVYENLGVIRTSIYDFFMTYYYSILYLLVEIIFLVSVGAFYGVLSKSREYSALITKIADKIKGKENFFIIGMGLIFALLTSIGTTLLFCITFIPFVINVLAKNGVNKFKCFAATFGSMMVGILGSTYGRYYGTIIEDVMPVSLSDGLVWKFLLLGSVFFILMSFVLMKIDGPKTAVEDLYPLTENEKKVKILPISIILGIFVVISFVAFIPWKEAFGIELFDNLYNNIMAFKIDKVPICEYLFNNELSTYPNGNYDKIFDISLLMIITSFIISKISKMKTNFYLNNLGNGIKKLAKPISIFILVNCVFVLTYWSSMGATIVNQFAPSGSKFNIFVMMFIALLLSILNVDHGYSLYSVGKYLSTLFIVNIIDIVIIMNAIYGVAQFIFPTSYLLFFALSYLDISYKEYLKNMWKFLIALIIAVVLLLLMAVYI